MKQTNKQTNIWAVWRNSDPRITIIIVIMTSKIIIIHVITPHTPSTLTVRVERELGMVFEAEKAGTQSKRLLETSNFSSSKTPTYTLLWNLIMECTGMFIFAIPIYAFLIFSRVFEILVWVSDILEFYLSLEWVLRFSLGFFSGFPCQSLPWVTSYPAMGLYRNWACLWVGIFRGLLLGIILVSWVSRTACHCCPLPFVISGHFGRRLGSLESHASHLARRSFEVRWMWC